MDVLLHGMQVTVVISAGSLLIGTLLGLVVALMRNSSERYVSFPALCFVEFFRNTPFLAQLFFFYYGLPELGIRTDPIVTSVIALGVNTGAYNSEVIRAGLLAVEKGTVEAGLALGMSKARTLWHIVLPITFSVAFKPLSSNFINLVLTTSAAASITARELTNSALIISADVNRPFELFVTILAAYCLLTFTLSALTKIIDGFFISKSWRAARRGSLGDAPRVSQEG